LEDIGQFLRVKSELRATSPSPTSLSFPKKTSDQNFKRAISFRIVERSSNCVFGNVNLPTVLRARAVS